MGCGRGGDCHLGKNSTSGFLVLNDLCFQNLKDCEYFNRKQHTKQKYMFEIQFEKLL